MRDYKLKNGTTLSVEEMLLIDRYYRCASIAEYALENKLVQGFEDCDESVDSAWEQAMLIGEWIIDEDVEDDLDSLIKIACEHVPKIMRSFD